MSPTEDGLPSTDLPPPAGIRRSGADVLRVNPLEDPRWDARLATCPAASFFHGSAWARVLHGTYGFSPVYFVLGPVPAMAEARLRANTEVSPPASLPSQGPEPVEGLVEQTSRLLHESQAFSALLPMVEVNSWLTGRRGVSLPFTDECEPLYSDVDSFRRVVQAALEYARVRAWKYVEFRGGRALLGEVPASTSFFGHRLDLRGDQPAIFARFDSSVRRAIRKAEQSGLTIEFSQDLEAVRLFYGLLCKTRQRHGVPPQPFRFFQNIQRHVLKENKGRVILARQGRVPVAGAVFFNSGMTATYKFGASNEAFQHLRGNNLVMWEAIKWHARQGFTTLDFGRTSLANDGLRKFKLGWGTQERTIDYVRYEVRTGRYVTATDESSGWHNRVFRLLPTPVSRIIGAALYRHVA